MTQVTARGEWTVLAAGRLIGAIDGAVIAIRWSSQSLFKFQQLAHKVEIWRDDWTTLFDHRVGFHQAQLGVTHQVSDGDGRRTGNASVAMNQHCSTGASRFICRKQKKNKTIRLESQENGFFRVWMESHQERDDSRKADRWPMRHDAGPVSHQRGNN